MVAGIPVFTGGCQTKKLPEITVHNIKYQNQHRTTDSVLRAGLLLPFIRNFTPEEMEAHTQNWSVVQDRRGVMLIGGNLSVLEYDGSRWRKIPHSPGSRAMHVDKNGRVWVGSGDNIGCLFSDSTGQLYYKGLKEKMDSVYQNVQTVTSITSDDTYCYAQAGNQIMRFPLACDTTKKPDPQVKVFRSPKTRFLSVQNVNGKILVHDIRNGIRELNDTGFVHFPGGNYFSGKPVCQILPYEEEMLLVCTYKNGMFLLDTKANTKPEQRVAPFRTEADSILYNGVLYRSVWLSNGSLAAGTLNQGAVILSKQGRILQQLDESTNLASSNIYNVGVDNHYGLWLTTSYGVSRVEVPCAFTYRVKSVNDRKLQCLSMAKLGHYLFVGTQLGLFVADARPENKNMAFYPVEAVMNQQVFGLMVRKNELLMGGSDQLAILSVPTATVDIQVPVRSKLTKLNISGVIGFAHSRFDSARVWVLTFNGLYSIRKENGKWKSEYATPILAGVKIQAAVEAAPGKLWLGAVDNGVYHVDFKDSLLPPAKSPIIKQYLDNQGLKTLNYNEVFADTGIGCKASNQKGIFRYSALGDSFVTDSSFDPAFMRTVSEYARFTLDQKGDYWLLYVDTANTTKMACFRKSNESGKYIKAEVLPSFMRVIEFAGSSIIADSFGIYWMAGEKGLIRYNSNEISFPSYDFKALIRQVKIGKDSSIYNGYDTVSTPVYKTPLKFKDNHLTFEFSAPAYDVHDQVFYRYALEGFDSAWSDWTREAKKEYTNLPEGEYHFRVYAKNVYLQTSQEAGFKFRILPPWYRTFWAYILYAVALGGGIYGVVLLQVARLRQQNRILEEKVAERTAEVVRQRDEIMLQKEEISNAYEEIRAINDNLSVANTEIQKQKDEIQEQNAILANAFEEIRAINESLSQANTEIEAQKKLVEDANHEITSSIEYARRIQDALLPPKIVLEKLFVESFIFYKPKSIVSGDFYWVYPNYIKEEAAPQYVYVAAADCTGHGVPGAFMSMLCSSLLNQAVQAEAGIRPAQLLSRVNTLLIQTLRQDREKIVRDGMDICLIRLEKIRTDPAPVYEVIFAGANNPLYCVRKGDVATFPVTKRPIGGGQFQETDFESYSFYSEPGDMLYLFSDGFPDQFGGAYRRKYTYRQFRELLVRISEFSTDKQFDIIQAELKDWQRHYEQLDDILVLGIRL